MHFRSVSPTTLGNFRFPAPPTALSEYFALVYSAVCSVPNSWRTRNQRHGFMVGWHWHNFASKPILFKMHDANLVSWFSGKFLKSLPPDATFKAKMHQIRFRLGLRPRPRCGGTYRLPKPIVGLVVLLIRVGREDGKEGRGKRKLE